MKKIGLVFFATLLSLVALIVGLVLVFLVFPIELPLKTLRPVIPESVMAMESELNGTLELNLFEESVVRAENLKLIFSGAAKISAKDVFISAEPRKILDKELNFSEISIKDLGVTVLKSEGKDEPKSNEKGPLFTHLRIGKIGIASFNLDAESVALNNTSIEGQSIVINNEDLSRSLISKLLIKIPSGNIGQEELSSASFSAETKDKKISIELKADKPDVSGTSSFILTIPEDGSPVILTKGLLNLASFQYKPFSTEAFSGEFDRLVFPLKSGGLPDISKIEFFAKSLNYGEFSIEDIGMRLGRIKSVDKKGTKNDVTIIKDGSSEIGSAESDDSNTKGADLEFSQVTIPESKNAKVGVQSLDLELQKMKWGDVVFHENSLKLDFDGDKAFDIELSSAQPNFSFKGHGELDENFKKADFDFVLERLNLGQLLTSLGKKNQVFSQKGELQGRGDLIIPFDGDLSQLNGDVELTSGEVSVKGFNLDGLLDHYIRSNYFSFLDVASFFALGPLGLVASKGWNLGNTVPSALSGTTQIEKTDIAANIKTGVVELQKASIKTENHLIKIKGTVELVGEKQIRLSVAPLNDKGCPHFVQKITGTIEKPDISAMQALTENTFAPMMNLVKSAGGLFSSDDDKCSKF